MELETEKQNGIDNSMSSKVCGVCGDKALGYNFNAVTCESCKAFFRRNALTNKMYRCPFSDKCEITTVTRRFCQKCRLEKCFSIGMRKEYIMSEEDKVLKRKKIEQNRAKKRHNNNNDDDMGFSKVKREETSEDSDTWFQNKDECATKLVENIKHSVSVITNGVSSLDNPILIGEKPFSKIITLSKSVENFAQILDEGTPESEYSQDGVLSPEYKRSNIGSTEPERSNGNYDTDQNAKSNSSMIRSILDPMSNSNEGPVLDKVTDSKAPNCDNKVPHRQNGRQNGADVARDILQDVQRIPIEPNSIESILCEAIKLEFEAYSSLAQVNNSSRELNDAERAKLNELIVANKALYAPLDEDLTNLVADDCRFKPNQNQQDPMLLGVINLTAVAIRRLIKMSKKISAFKNMCQEDQVALLKGGCTEMMILRSAMTYDCDRDTWKIPHIQEAMSNIKADVLKRAKGNIYQEHERFIRTFDQRWRMDENIILIMCAITLFTPDRPRVVHSDVIKLEQNSYYYLLRRYLESVYAGCEAKSTFLKLIQKISELHRLNEEVVGVYLDVNPSHVEPLLIEIFDLKPH